MKQKYPLSILGVLCLFLTTLGAGKTAKANVFDEAFGIISGYSRTFGFSRSRHYSKRRYKRRRYSSRRRARRSYRSRRHYRRKILRQRARRRKAERRRAYAMRRKRIAARRRAKMARIISQRNQRKAQSRVVKLRRVQKRREQRRLARSLALPAKRYARTRKKPVRSKARIAKAKLRQSQPRKAIIAKVREGAEARRPRSRRVAKRHIVEQARSGLSYGRSDEASFLSHTEKKKVQRALSVAGFYQGAHDGIFGRHTRSAIRAYQKSLSQVRTGRLNHVQIASLLGAVSVSKNDSADYLPQRERQVKKRERVRKRAKALNDRLKAQALAERQRLAKAQKTAVIKPVKVHAVAVKKLSIDKQNDRLKSEIRVAAKRVKMPLKPKKNAMPKEQRKALFSLVSKPALKASSLKALKPYKQASLQRKNTGQSKASRKVDYFHILTKTQRGENLWVVKCVHKQQLKLYYWRDQKWWVRGSKGGAVGHSEYGENGIQQLAKKVCTI